MYSIGGYQRSVLHHDGGFALMPGSGVPGRAQPMREQQLLVRLGLRVAQGSVAGSFSRAAHGVMPCVSSCFKLLQAVGREDGSPCRLDGVSGKLPVQVYRLEPENPTRLAQPVGAILRELTRQTFPRKRRRCARGNPKLDRSRRFG